MACSNCFNGCPEITSDKCVKYTGVDVPALGIKNGDSLSYVEQTLIGFLVPVLNGSGIVPNIVTSGSSGIICELISSFLPDCGDITLNVLLTALIRAICSLQDQIETDVDNLDNILAGYTADCLSEPYENNRSNIKDVLQATINKVCELTVSLESLGLDLSTNYVNIADLNALIQDYLDSIATNTLLCNKMVPFTVVEYYGTLSGYPTPSDGFGVSGAGYGAWLNVYLCNGENGTPDKRGRVGVGDTVSMGGSALDPDRAAFPYTKGVAQGTNTVTLIASQMPTHTHTASPTIDDPGHYHFEFSDFINGSVITSTLYPCRSKNTQDNLEYQIEGLATPATVGKSSISKTNLTITVNNSNAGSSAPHLNMQPGLGCYYIMYIP